MQPRTYRFSEEKNRQLKQRHGVNFDDVIVSLEHDDLLDTSKNASPHYPHQLVFVVRIGRYAYAVPFVEHDGEVFLKTVYPSRKLTKRYLTGGNYDQ